MGDISDCYLSGSNISNLHCQCQLVNSLEAVEESTRLVAIDSLGIEIVNHKLLLISTQKVTSANYA